MLTPVYALALHLMVGSSDISADMGKIQFEYGSKDQCLKTEELIRKSSIGFARFDSKCVPTGNFAEFKEQNYKQVMLIQGFLIGDKLQHEPYIQTWTYDMSGCQLAMELTRRQALNRANANVALACLPSLN